LRGACDQLAHFLVGGLREISLKLPDCLEIFRRDLAQRSATSSSNSRHISGEPTGTGGDDFPRASLTQSRNRSAHPRARREAVIDQNDYAPAHPRRGTAIEVTGERQEVGGQAA